MGPSESVPTWQVTPRQRGLCWGGGGGGLGGGGWGREWVGWGRGGGGEGGGEGGGGEGGGGEGGGVWGGSQHTGLGLAVSTYCATSCYLFCMTMNTYIRVLVYV